MKSILGTFIVLIVLGLLTSCGNQPSKTTFEITSSALSTSNSTYEGGLVIMGKSSSGEFTIPVSFSGSGSNSVTLEVPKDKWTFWAIGWIGAGSTPKLFQGETRCGVTTADLTQSEQTVNISLNPTNCTTRPDIFGDASNYYVATKNYQPFRTVTCGWLYTDAIGGTPVSPSTPSNFCDVAAPMNSIFKVHSQSVKVEVSENIFGAEKSGLSMCFTSSNGVLNGRNPSIPSIGLPVKISLYRDTSCSENLKIATYNFPKGISVQQGNQDSVFGVSAGTMNLFLPANALKKGYTSFADSMPRITCAGNDCMGMPSGAPADRFIKSGSEFLIQNPGSGYKCSDISSVSPSGSFSTAPDLTSIVSKCRETDNGGLVTSIDFTSISSASITISFTKNSSTQNYTYTLASDPSYTLYETGWAIFGYPQANYVDSKITASFDIFYNHDIDHARGILAKVTHMFSPDGAAGGLGQLTCSSSTKESQLSFVEDGVTKTYRAKLSSSPALIGSYLTDGSHSPTANFQKRLIVQRLSDDLITYTTEIVIDFNCGEKIGHLESVEQKDGREERIVLSWNTITDGAQKVLAYTLSEETDGSGVVRSETAKIEAKQVNTNIAQATIFHLKIERQTDSSFHYDADKSILYANASTPNRLFMKRKVIPQIGFTSANDATFDDGSFGTLLASSPSNFCVNISGAGFTELYVGADSNCVGVEPTVGSLYGSETETYENLLKANLNSVSTFTPNLADVN